MLSGVGGGCLGAAALLLDERNDLDPRFQNALPMHLGSLVRQRHVSAAWTDVQACLQNGGEGEPRAGQLDLLSFCTVSRCAATMGAISSANFFKGALSPLAA